ncbi:MAG: dihydroorotase [Rhodobacteraceae bacterium]|nr:dihydroorotase [Paracoccaceae bacterium]MCY4195414.1 dihydroorotase [Paracoccaceae bacterium]
MADFDLVLSNALLVNPELDSIVEGTLAVSDGRIAAMGKDVPTDSGALQIDCAGACLAPGIVDIGVKIGEPGERHKESFGSAARAAAAGGVTTIVTRPDTTPPIDNPETLQFFQQRARAAAKVRIKPMAALTKERAGSEMTEINLLLDVGAVAFSDCDSPVRDGKVMSRCLSYCSQHGALVIGHPQEPDLSRHACATAGPFAVLMGIPTVSSQAEMMGLERDLALVAMTQARYHADQITTAAALPVLERYLDNGCNVTAGTSIHHLTLNEFDIAGYRTFYKVKPPLRAESDRQATVDALARGLISVISSMHTPQDEESKRLPFESAASGAVALETLLPAALRLHHTDGLGLPTLFRALSLNPSRLLELGTGRLSPGAPADLVLFDPDKPYTLDRTKLHSKSRNTPFDGQVLQGQVLRTFRAGQEIFRNDT